MQSNAKCVHGFTQLLLQEYKIETKISIIFCGTETSEVRFATIYVRLIWSFRAVRVLGMAETV